MELSRNGITFEATDDANEVDIYSIPNKKWKVHDHSSSETTERVVDEKVRKCHIYNDSFTMTLSDHNTEIESKLLDEVGPSAKIRLGEPELLKYVVGSHFANHCDRNRGTLHSNAKFYSQKSCKYIFNHVGTLLYIGFSPTAEGGELLINDEVSVLRTASHKKWQWFVAYVDLNTSHSVNELILGERFCIKRPVYLHQGRRATREDSETYDRRITEAKEKQKEREEKDEEYRMKMERTRRRIPRPSNPSAKTQYLARIEQRYLALKRD